MDSENMDIFLISSVEEYRLIYDKSNKYHKDRNIVLNSWREIASKLNTSVEECPKRWNVLRTRYNKEKREERQMPSGSEARVKKPWPFLPYLTFLDQYIKPRKTFGNIFSCTPDSVVKNATLSTEADETIEIVNDHDFNIEEMTSPCSSVHQSSNEHQTPYKRAKRSTATSETNTTEKQINVACQEISQYIQNKPQYTAPPSDENYSLCMQLYCKLKQMGTANSKKYRKDILKMLLQMEDEHE